jgi:hypothetical protein
MVSPINGLPEKIILGCGLNGSLGRDSHIEIARVCDKKNLGDPFPERSNDFAGPIGTSIVDHDDLIVFDRLSE